MKHLVCNTVPDVKYGKNWDRPVFKQFENIAREIK